VVNARIAVSAKIVENVEAMASVAHAQRSIPAKKSNRKLYP
jgi:hypothetical protein